MLPAHCRSRSLRVSQSFFRTGASLPFGWSWDRRLDMKTARLPNRPLAALDRAGAGGRNPPRQNFRALNLLLVVTPQRSPNAGSRSVSGVARAVFIRTVCALISLPRARPAEMPATHHRAPSDHRALEDKPGHHRSALDKASLVNPGPALIRPLPPREAIQPRSHLSPTKFHELRETACRSILAMSVVG